MPIAQCRQCGRAVTTEATICPHCGTPSPAQAPAPEPVKAAAPAPKPPASPAPAPAPAPKPQAPAKPARGSKAAVDTRPPEERAGDLVRKAGGKVAPVGEMGVRGPILALLLFFAGLYFGFLGVRDLFRGEPWERVFVEIAGGGFLLWVFSELIRYTTAALIFSGVLMLALGGWSGYLLQQPGGSTAWPALGVATSLLLLDFLRKRRKDFLGGGLDELVGVYRPFEVVSLPRGRPKDEAVVVEINNLIARAGSISDVTRTQVDEVAKQHGVTDLSKAARNARESMYVAYLRHFVQDGRLGNDDRLELDLLAQLLSLDDKVTAALQKPLREDLYRDRARAALLDNELNAGERQELEAIRDSVGMTEGAARGIRGEFSAEAFRRAVKEALADGYFTPEDIRRLAAEQEALGVPEETARAIRSTEASLPYARAVEQAMRDGAVSPEEEERLKLLAEGGALPEKEVRSVRLRVAGERLRGALEAALKEEKLSPDEDRKLREMAASLGVPLELDERTRRKLARARTLWQIDHGALPVVATEAALDAGERCHVEAMAEVYELRDIVTGKRVTVEKEQGIFGGERTVVRERDETTRKRVLVDRGPLLVTDRRLIFRGRDGSESFPFATVVAVKASGSTVTVDRDGRDRAFDVEEDPDVFARIAQRALRDFKARA